MKLLSCVLFLAAIFTAVYASDNTAAAASAVPTSGIVDLNNGSTPSPSPNFTLNLATVVKQPGSSPQRIWDELQLEDKVFLYNNKEIKITGELLSKLLRLIVSETIDLNKIDSILFANRKKGRKDQGNTARGSSQETSGQPVLEKYNYEVIRYILLYLLQAMNQNQFQPACAVNAERTEWEKEQSALKARIAELESVDIAEATSAPTIADLKKQLEALEKKNKDLEAINREEIKQKTQAIIEKTQAIDRIAAAEREKTEALTAMENLAKSLADLEKKFNAAEAEIKQANAEKKAARAEADRHAEAQRELQEQLDAVTQRADILEGENTALQGQVRGIDALNVEKEAATCRAEQLHRELSELRRTSEEAVRQVHAEREAARQRDHAGEEEKRRLQNELEAAMRRVEVAETARDSTERNAADLRILQDRLEEANQRAAAAETAIQGKQLRLDEALRYTGVLEAQNGALQIQVNSIAVLNADIAQLRRDLQITQPLAARVHGLQQDMLRLQAALDAARAAARAAAPAQHFSYAPAPQPALVPQTGEQVVHKGGVPKLGRR